MLDYHNNIICLTDKDIVKHCGISDGYLRRALSGQRKGTLYCWEHHQDNGTTYIHYYSLKDKYKELIKKNLCNNFEPDVFLKLKDQAPSKLTKQAISSIQDLVVTDTNELELLASTKLYTYTEAQAIARAAGWFRLINNVDIKNARKLGFRSIVSFREEILARITVEQNAQPFPLVKFKKGNITNVRVLTKNAKLYKDENINALIHAGVGNTNHSKANKFTHSKLIQLHSEPVKYSFEDTAMMYNDWALENDQPQLKISAVKEFLNRPAIKKIWYYQRHGKLAADNDIQQTIARKTPSFPDALWSLDGSTVQLYYLDEKGVMRSDLYVYFVIDACTGAIIGYSIAYAETALLVDEALRCAISTHSNKPYQLQYDNSSANQSKVVQNLMSNMSRVHFPCEPYKGRSKYVEGVIGHFQQQVLRKSEFFKGGNVTTKSLDSKANPELLKKLKQNKDLLPSLDEVINIFGNSVADWNNRTSERDSYGRFIGDSFITKYNTIQHAKRKKLNYFDKISLFMVEQKEPYTYSTQGVKININNKNHYYIVPDNDKLGDFIFANQHLGEKFVVKIDRKAPYLCGLYERKGKDLKHIANAYEKTHYAACAADMKKGEGAKIKALQHKQNEWGQEYSIKELDRQLSILEELQATGTDSIDWWDNTKHQENAKQNKLEDIANGVSEGISPKIARMLQIGQ